MRRIAALILPMTAAVFASSIEAQSGGPYAGLSYSRVSYAEANVIQNFSVDGTEDETGFFGGYRFNDHVAIEGSWLDLSGFGGSFVYDDPVLGMVDVAFNASYTNYSARVLGILSKDNVDFFAGLGAYAADFDGYSELPFFTDSGIPVENMSTEQSGLTAIAGIEFRLTQFGIRLQYEWFDPEPGVDVSTLALGFAFHFR